jgi:hypothetical protein
MYSEKIWLTSMLSNGNTMQVRYVILNALLATLGSKQQVELILII